MSRFQELLSFNEVAIGEKKSKNFTLLNPSTEEQEITFIKNPNSEKGFSVDRDPKTAFHLRLPPKGKLTFKFNWEPPKVGKYFETVMLQSNEGKCHQFVWQIRLLNVISNFRTSPTDQHDGNRLRQEAPRK